MDQTFFVPGAADEAEAEFVYGQLEASVGKRFGPLERVRYEALYCKPDGVHRTFRVGLADPASGETVVAIFRNAEDGRYLLLTPSHGCTAGDPIVVTGPGLPVRFHMETPPVVEKPEERPAAPIAPEGDAGRRRRKSAQSPGKRQTPRKEPRKRATAAAPKARQPRR